MFPYHSWRRLTCVFMGVRWGEGGTCFKKGSDFMIRKVGEYQN